MAEIGGVRVTPTINPADYKKANEAVKTDVTDNVVHVDSKGNFNKEDFKAASKDAFMFVKNEAGEIFKIDLKANKGFVDDALKKLDKNENFSLKVNLPPD